MRYLQRLVRNLKTSWKFHSKSGAGRPLRTNEITLGSKRRQGLTNLLPTKLYLDVKVVPIKEEQVVRVQTVSERTGARGEVMLYDDALLEPKMREVADQLGHSGVQLVCCGREYYEGENQGYQPSYRIGQIIFTKQFPILAAGLYHRRLMSMQGIAGVLPIDGAHTGWVKDYDFLPYGGRFVNGGSLDDIQAYFAQIRNGTGHASVLLSHARFWNERGVDPSRGGIYRDKAIHFSLTSSPTQTSSLGEDIRAGSVRLIHRHKGMVVGEWKSRAFKTLEPSANKITIEFLI